MALKEVQAIGSDTGAEKRQNDKQALQTDPDGSERKRRPGRG